MLTETDYYKEAISKQAKVFTEKLQKILKPFLSRNKQDLQERFSAMMTRIFQDALKVHVRTRISRQNYEWFWPSESDVWHRPTTRVEGEIVIFALTPAHHLWEYGKLEGTEGPIELVVDMVSSWFST